MVDMMMMMMMMMNKKKKSNKIISETRSVPDLK